MSDIRRIDPGPRLSEASVYGDRMYLSGMIPEDTSQDITGQVKQALAEIDSLLAKGGSDKTKILTATIWLADIGDFAALNAVWDAWVAARPDTRPRHGSGQAERSEDEGRDHGGCRPLAAARQRAYPRAIRDEEVPMTKQGCRRTRGRRAASQGSRRARSWP